MTQDNGQKNSKNALKNGLPKIGLLGSTGRVGRLLIDEITQSSEAILSAIFVREKLDFALPQPTSTQSQNIVVTNNFNELIKNCDVIIDFSSPKGSASLLNSLQNALDSMQNLNDLNKVPACVIGTTGLAKEDFALMESISLRTPLLYAANMSLGIAILRKVAQEVASKLANADIEISEIHHRFKKDAPSGTALALAHSCAKGRGLIDKTTKNLAQNPQHIFITDRASVGERQNSQISIASLRGGDVAGRHTVGFYMQGEYLEFTHNATNRLTFAKGALACALWLVRQKPKLYDIEDMLS